MIPVLTAEENKKDALDKKQKMKENKQNQKRDWDP